MEYGPIVEDILNMHIELMSQDLEAIDEGSQHFRMRRIDEEDLEKLSEITLEIFQSENMLLKLQPPFVVIGDLHGHIIDLYRILRQFDLPPARKYLFLGDLVDRGSFSIETLSLVFALKVLYPNHVFVIRGNHEFESISLTGGFFTEIISTYGTPNLFNRFVQTFDWMPVAAQIGKILCVHAGLAPEFRSIAQIEEINRPQTNSDNIILTGILWSDPSAEPSTFCASRRGTGFLFNLPPLKTFLQQNKLTKIVRGHECVNGVTTMWDNMIITVFSASNYCGITGNKGGVLMIDGNEDLSPKLFSPFRRVSRSEGFNTQQKHSTMNLPVVSDFRPKNFIPTHFSSLKMHKIARVSRVNEQLSMIAKPSLPHSKSVFL